LFYRLLSIYGSSSSLILAGKKLVLVYKGETTVDLGTT